MDQTNPPPPPSVFSRERLLAVVLAAVTVIAVYLCYLLTQPLLPGLTLAVTLAVIAHPLHRWVARRVPNTNAAAGLTVLLVAALIVAPAVLVAQQLVREAAETVTALQHDPPQFRRSLAAYPWLTPALAWLENNFDPAALAQQVAPVVTGQVTAFVSGSAGALAQVLVALYALFFCFRDEEAALRAVRSVLPLSPAEASRVFRRAGDTVYATVYGRLFVAALQGVFGGLMFGWLGLPTPVLWGTVMATLSVIPMLGSYLVWVPAVVILAGQGDWARAAILTAWGAVVLGGMDLLLYPMIAGRRARLHPLPMFLALVGGLAAFGLPGVVLGPVILAVTMALLEVWRQRVANAPPPDTGPKT
jgi:predicted PurR-regulated permease PerM